MRVPCFPWSSLARPFVISVDGLRIDGKEVSVESSPLPIHQLAESSWTTADIDLRASIPAEVEEQCGYLLDSVQVVLTLLDGATNNRIAVRTEGIGNERQATLNLHREEVSGRCQVAGVLTREIGGVSNREVGRARPLLIDFDQPVAVQIAGKSPFPMVWTDFANPIDTAPEALTAVKDNPFWFDQSPGDPVLWLNDGIAYLNNVLRDAKPKGRSKDAQALVGSWIAAGVWNALFERAMSDLSSGEDDEPIEVLDPLSAKVLESLVPHTEGVADVDELTQQMAVARNDPDTRRHLAARTQVAIARLCAANDTIAKTVRNTWHES